MSEVTVVALFTAKEGHEDRVESTLATGVAAAHGEEGCLKYVLARDKNAPAVFATIEKWSSQEALDTHLTQPTLGPVIEMAGESLDAPIQMHVFTEIPAGDADQGAL